MSSHYISLNNYPKNIGGSIQKAGKIDNRIENRLSMVSLENYILRDYPYSTRVILNNDTYKPLSDEWYIFAYDNQRPLIKGTTRLINTASIDHELQSGGIKSSNLRTNIHYRTRNINRLESTAMRNNRFNRYTGKYESGFPLTTIDNFGEDRAAEISRENPGTLVFATSNTPVVKNYEPKR